MHTWRRTGPLKLCITDLDNYDCLVVCCPIWASRTPPFVNQYLMEVENTREKSLHPFVITGGNGSQVATVQIQNALEAKRTKLQEFAQYFH